ncbi:MAG TPA: methyltransferase domain-containing protein [Tepidimicrobium sp.]|nr:methyltransferase domain-containing protein [Tepidimicrobium sp.]
MREKPRFVPALKFDWLTRFFDPLMKLSMVEKRFREALLFQANIKDSDIILDFGCGTGTLLIMVKERFPNAIAYGVDIDSNILKIAQEKVKDSGHEIFLNSYDGILLPYGDKMFDKVLSSLVFHHLARDQKIAALKGIHRILRRGGELHILDFGKAQNILMRGMFLPIQIFDGFANTSDNVKGLLPKIIEEAGFDEVVENKRINTLFGTISLYSAVKLG